MCQILVTGDLASSESQARPNAAEPASLDLTNEDYDKEEDKEEEEQEEEKEKEQDQEEEEEENDQEEEGKEEEMVTLDVEVADSPDDGNPEEYQDCQEYRADLVPPGPPPGPPPKRTTGGPVPPPGPPPKKISGKNKAGEPFLDDDHDWQEEINVWRWWVNFGGGESHERQDENEEEVKEEDLVKEQEVSDEAEGEKDDEQMPGDDASYVSSEEVDGFDLLRDDVM